MNREKIISLAKSCNILNEIEILECNPGRQETIRELTEFYHAVRNEALEEAAKECDERFTYYSRGACEGYEAENCAAAIRALKETK